MYVLFVPPLRAALRHHCLLRHMDHLWRVELQNLNYGTQQDANRNITVSLSAKHCNSCPILLSQAKSNRESHTIAPAWSVA